MLQAQLNGLLQFLLGSLDYDNRLWLSQHLIEPQTAENDIHKQQVMSWDDLKNSVRVSRLEIAQGKIYTDAEDDAVFDSFLQEELGVKL